MLRSSLTPIGYLWVLLSICLACCCSASFYLPNWLNGGNLNNSSSSSSNLNWQLGLFRRCNYPALLNGVVEIIEKCGMYASFNDIPNIWWKVCVVCMALAMFFTCTIAFMGLFALCIGDAICGKAALLCGVCQGFAGFLLVISGTLFYPLGWNGLETKQVCGEDAAFYVLGRCQIGYAYFIAAVATILAFICPFLSCYSVRKDVEVEIERKSNANNNGGLRNENIYNYKKIKTIKPSCSQLTDIQQM